MSNASATTGMHAIRIIQGELQPVIYVNYQAPNNACAVETSRNILSFGLKNDVTCEPDGVNNASVPCSQDVPYVNQAIMEDGRVIHANTLYTCSPDVDFPTRKGAADLVYTSLSPEEVVKLQNVKTKASLPVFMRIAKQNIATTVLTETNCALYTIAYILWKKRRLNYVIDVPVMCYTLLPMKEQVTIYD